MAFEEELYAACEKGKKEEVIPFLNLPEGAVDYNFMDGLGRTPLYIACKEGHAEVVKLLLNHPKIDVNKTHNKGVMPLYIGTPLFVACQAGKIEIVELLLNHPDILVNQPSHDDATPLHAACGKGHIEIVKLLIENPAMKDINQPMQHGITPFFSACFSGEIKVIQYLLEDPRTDITKEKSKIKPFITVGILHENCPQIWIAFFKRELIKQPALIDNQDLQHVFKTLQPFFGIEDDQITLKSKDGILELTLVTCSKTIDLTPLLQTAQQQAREKIAFDFFIATLLFTDGYIQLKTNMEHSPLGRVLRMTQEMPFEMQSVLWKRACKSSGTFFPAEKATSTIKEMFKKFSH